MKFEWDEDKNQRNLIKHGIDFYVATEIFSDPHAIEATRMVSGEERIQLIGKIDKYIFSVVYTQRTPNIRIISARFASKKERQLYG